MPCDEWTHPRAHFGWRVASLWHNAVSTLACRSAWKSNAHDAICLLKQKPHTAVDADIDDVKPQDMDTAGLPGGAVLCRHCSAQICAPDSACMIAGSQQHTFCNPSGILFEISCFADAPGCQIRGEATYEFSWFASYAWRYALCAGCHQHLGWFFAKPAHSFFALINKNILIVDGPTD